VNQPPIAVNPPLPNRGISQICRYLLFLQPPSNETLSLNKRALNLIIDIGTSFIKTAVIHKQEILFKEMIPDISDKYLSSIIRDFPQLKHAILSNVRKKDQALLNFLNNKFDCFIELTAETPIPLKNLYKSPVTLGYDRLATSVGANNIFPRSNVLVIDIGSAITIDFVNDKNEYTGGNISPGMSMRFKALNQYTANLPLEKPQEYFEFLGSGTSGAIVNGVQNGILYELEGYISRLARTKKNLKVILTGGDANFFAKKLKNSIFVDLNLTIKGLNKILEYNIEKD
jgi:type III pantothenate kinase